VTALVAELVGESGEVVGMDRDAVQVYGARARLGDLPNASFCVGEITQPPSGPFDAVVGRLVLMYQPSMSDALRCLREVLRPGGVMAFIETSLNVDQTPPMWPPQGTLGERIGELIRTAFSETSVQQLAGLRLPAAMRDAGLQPVHPYESGSIIYEGRSAAVMQASLFRSMVPVLQNAGADLSGIDLDRLDDDLEREHDIPQVVAIGPLLGVWARQP
jgi:SAM-dependent methyltransferase